MPQILEKTPNPILNTPALVLREHVDPKLQREILSRLLREITEPYRKFHTTTAQYTQINERLIFVEQHLSTTGTFYLQLVIDPIISACCDMKGLGKGAVTGISVEQQVSKRILEIEEEISAELANSKNTG